MPKPRKGPAPSPAPATGKSTAAALRRKRAAEAARLRELGIFPEPATGRDGDRVPADLVDWTDPDSLDLWLAGALRDWQLQVGAAEFERLAKVLGNELAADRAKRADVRNDLRQEGYLDGRINLAETVIQQLERAIAARRGRIGEDPAEAHRAAK